MNRIDCRDMACPGPVITAKKALQEHNEMQILVDDGAPRENVTRFARNRGFQVSEEQDRDGWLLTITGTPETRAASHVPNADRIMLITSNRLGDGPEELGNLLMRNFIHTLLETSDVPSRMFFINTGVLLTTDGSDVLEALEKLVNMGVEVFSCGLCLDFLKLKEKLRVGGTTNMLTIAENLLAAGQIVRL